MKEPETPDEWQIAVNAAATILRLEAGREYGLLTSPPLGDIARCRQILLDGRKQGRLPADGYIAGNIILRELDQNQAL